MKLLFTSFCLLFSLTISAQENKDQENNAAKAVVEKLIDFYNTDRFSDLHQLLSDNFRKQVQVSQTIAFYQDQLKKPLGKIISWQYLGMSTDSKLSPLPKYTYRIDFEKLKLSMDMIITPDQHIDYINWTEYIAKKVILKPRDPASIKTNNPRLTPLQLHADALAMAYLKDPDHCSLAIGLVNGEKTETFFYGETKKGTGLLPDAGSLYEIGSISKTFTAILLAHAVNEGKLSLDDDIRKYLPGKYPALQFKETPIKIVNLSNHTSGLPSLPADFDKQPGYDPANPYLHYSKEMIYKFLATAQPQDVPGKVSSYSNLGFAVLGAILEEAYHMPFENLLQALITKPLKMQHTHFEVAGDQLKKLTTGYSNETGKEVSHWDLVEFNAAGGLKSNLTDMLLYLKANITSKNKDFLLSYQVTDHQEDFERGLSWMIQPLEDQTAKNQTVQNQTTAKQSADEKSKTRAAIKPLPKTETVIWHNGGTGGYRSFLGFVKERKCGVVIFSNSNSSVDGIALELLSDLTYSVSPQK